MYPDRSYEHRVKLFLSPATQTFDMSLLSHIDFCHPCLVIDAIPGNLSKEIEAYVKQMRPDAEYHDSPHLVLVHDVNVGGLPIMSLGAYSQRMGTDDIQVVCEIDRESCIHDVSSLSFVLFSFASSSSLCFLVGVESLLNISN